MKRGGQASNIRLVAAVVAAPALKALNPLYPGQPPLFPLSTCISLPSPIPTNQCFPREGVPPLSYPFHSVIASLSSATCRYSSSVSSAAHCTTHLPLHQRTHVSFSALSCCLHCFPLATPLLVPHSSPIVIDPGCGPLPQSLLCFFLGFSVSPDICACFIPLLPRSSPGPPAVPPGAPAGRRPPCTGQTRLLVFDWQIWKAGRGGVGVRGTSDVDPSRIVMGLCGDWVVEQA